MKLPSWVPMVSRPHNPAYGPVWDKMSDDAKRWSWLFDAAIVAAALTVMGLL